MNLKKYIFLFVLLFAGLAYAQQDFSKVDIKTIQLTPGLYMLAGAGGNLGLSVGENGAFLIDDQYAPLTEKIKKAIADETDKPITFLINTHWHMDHTGGNENFGKGGTIIVAHNNVRKRMEKGQFMKAFNFDIPPAPDAALPVVTFPKSLTFHWNDETIEVVHLPESHTDGDAVIFFKEANVIHTGDIFFNGIYPFIDAGSGGTLKGMLKSIDLILERTSPDTRIIPGHGPLADVSDLKAYKQMLSTVYGRISKLMKEGKSVEEIIALKPTADLDAQWGNGFLKPDQWVGIVCSVIQ